MDWSELRINPARSDGESLTACLNAVAGLGGSTIEYDDLHAALGLSFLVTAGRPDGSVAGGERTARDWNLLRAAGMFGIELRPLHPPAAAVGLRDAAEFEQHFRDSYAPLIRQALDHGHAVLAWQGWPEPSAWDWGVVTSAANTGLGLAGRTQVGQSGMVALTGPVIQAYVIEVLSPGTRPSDDNVLRDALLAAHRVVSNELPTDFGVVTGSAAYGAWRQWPGTDAASRGRLYAAVCSVLASRRSAARFLQRHREANTANAGVALQAVEHRLQAVIEAARVCSEAAADADGDPGRTRETLVAMQNEERLVGDAVCDAVSVISS